MEQKPEPESDLEVSTIIESYNSLPVIAKRGLYYLIIITFIICLFILVFYKGMIYQCEALGYHVYSSDENWRGFACQVKPRLKFTEPLAPLSNYSLL